MHHRASYWPPLCGMSSAGGETALIFATVGFALRSEVCRRTLASDVGQPAEHKRYPEPFQETTYPLPTFAQEVSHFTSANVARTNSNADAGSHAIAPVRSDAEPSARVSDQGDQGNTGGRARKITCRGGQTKKLTSSQILAVVAKERLRRPWRAEASGKRKPMRETKTWRGGKRAG